jgi:hypothetical protein
MTRISLLSLFLVAISSCSSGRGLMNSSRLHQFATRYTAAWCSQDAV